MHSNLKSALLVVGPHPEHLDDMLGAENLVDQTVLDVDASREGAAEIPDELLERWRGLERVDVKDW